MKALKSLLISKIDIQESVDRQSKVIEEMVREYPDEYYWFHKKFKHFYEKEYEK